MAEIDLMITDLAMPDQEGIETIRTVRRTQAHLKIIAMSGTFWAMLHAAEILGAEATIAKPIDANELLNTVRSVMLGRRDAN